MPLLAGRYVEGYPRTRMPRPAYGDGPWGEAIRYWLTVRKLRQSDLVRLMRDRDPKDTTTPNTISNATRGLPTTTRVLDKIARALKVPIDAVLVSPERKLANEERRQLIQEITERVVRTMESGPAVPAEPTAEDVDRAMKVIQRSIELDAAHADARHAALLAKSEPSKIDKTVAKKRGNRNK